MRYLYLLCFQVFSPPILRLERHFNMKHRLLCIHVMQELEDFKKLNKNKYRKTQYSRKSQQGWLPSRKDFIYSELFSVYETEALSALKNISFYWSRIGQSFSLSRSGNSSWNMILKVYPTSGRSKSWIFSTSVRILTSAVGQCEAQLRCWKKIAPLANIIMLVKLLSIDQTWIHYFLKNHRNQADIWDLLFHRSK